MCGIVVSDGNKDEQEYHQAQMVALQGQYDRLKNRTHEIYIDKLDGKVDKDFYEEKVQEWRDEMGRIKATIEEHEDADSSYLAQGVHILELSQKAYSLYVRQKASEKRKLLNFVLSNCTLADGNLTPTYRKPFDLLAKGPGRSNWYA